MFLVACQFKERAVSAVSDVRVEGQRIGGMGCPYRAPYDLREADGFGVSRSRTASDV